MASVSIWPMKLFCRAMVNKFQTIRSGLYPLWLIGANLSARLGGMVILLIIGHSFAAEVLGEYFKALALIGLAITATQAGSGPLLVRLAQSRSFVKARFLVILRLVIALVSTVLVIKYAAQPLGQFWPLMLMPFACALSPDWIVAAQTRFSRLGLIAVLGQVTGIMVAVWASVSQSPDALYGIAPAISLASLVFACLFAFKRTGNDSDLILPARHGDNVVGLVGFTLLAGFLPNLDFVLMGAEDGTLFLAQRVFLLCAGLTAAIASTLFAKRQSGHLRDFWLLMPMASVSLMLFFWPEALAKLIYGAPSDLLISALQAGAAWPMLFALLTRQILILQENTAVRLVGWICLALAIITAFSIPNVGTATGVMVLIELRLAVLMVILFACQRYVITRQVTA